MTDASPPPLVSIAIPAGDPAWLGECLDSAAAQDYPTIEIVVLDYSPGDEVATLCAARSGIRLIRETNDLAALAAATRGRYIKFLRTGDRLAPDCVGRLVDAIRQAPEARMAFALSMQIDERGKMLGVAQKIQFASSLQLLDGNALRRMMACHCENLVGESSAALLDGDWLRQAGNRAYRGRTTGHRFSALADVACYCNAAEDRPVAFVGAVLSSCRNRRAALPAAAVLAGLCDWRQLIAEVEGSDPRFSEDRAAAINTYNNLVADFAEAHPDETASALAARFDDRTNPHYLDFLACRAQIDAGHADQALPKLLSLADSGTACWQVYDTLADIALARGDDRAALAYVAAAARRACGIGPLTLKLAILLIGAYRLDEGLARLQAYLACHPDDAAARQLLASIVATPASAGEIRRNSAGLAAYACLAGDYERWLTRTPAPRPASEFLHTFEFVVIVHAGDEAGLANTIDTVTAQSDDRWRLTILADFAPPNPAWCEAENLTWQTLGDLSSSAGALMKTAATSPADWLIVTTAGTLFAPDYLRALAGHCERNPQQRLIYADDDHFDPNGKRCLPRFKPDFSRDYFYAFDYLRDVAVARKALLDARPDGLESGAETYDIALGITERFGDTAIGHLDEILVHAPLAPNRSVNDDATRRVLVRHFARQSQQVEILDGPTPPLRRIRHRHAATPKVSIIIPSKNQLHLLQPCIDSLLTQTRYPDWELIVVDNGSDAPEIAAYYARLRNAQSQRVRILDYRAEFNYSAMNNLAAAEASGDYLLLLNNDTVAIEDDWLDEMMSHAQRPEIGVVGARLLYPASRRIQHAGVVLGMDGAAGHPFIDQLSPEQPGYLYRAQTVQNYSAVTGACLLVRASLYRQVGGLDAEALPVNYSDLDLCLKIRRLGYRVLWTPYATLLHHGSASQLDEHRQAEKKRAAGKRLQEETYRFVKRWRETLAADPAWNRNLSLASTKPAVEDELVAAWDQACHERPRLLAMPLESPGQAEYRVLAPLRALTEAALAHTAAVCQPGRGRNDRAPTPIELARLAPDALLMHAPVDDTRCIALLHYKELNPDVLRVYSLDDLITDIPADNPASLGLAPEVMRERLRLGLAASDRLIVSTAPLAELCRNMIDDIRIIPNMLERRRWEHLRPQRRDGRRRRVGWAGAQQHGGDLRFVLDVVKATHTEIDWVFFGMLPEGAKPYIAEFHDFVRNFDDYPAKLASLDLDLAIAPLVLHPFNEAKSNLRLLEYGILGWPVVCTDIYPYRSGNPPVTRLANDAAAWIDCIRSKIRDRDALAEEGEALRAWVRASYLLEDHLGLWLDALTR
ncbi:glycosyltransferase [Azospira restricta]|uniref:Glycosyltransferase n=1 Tax=Azospira restricta TaxID=404405 RepID=A0A974SS88_9RHOO|nr:glycosyltransferase [Azospira restricta]QRJ65487.1 glycosyltransferase [Azospira restricta]